MLKKIKQRLGLQHYLLKVRFRLWRERADFLSRVAAAEQPKVVIGSSGVFSNGWIPSNESFVQ